MKQRIACISLLVKDYDEAISFFSEKLNFELIEDTFINAEKRWVIMSPPGSSECSILMAKASNSEQIKYVGNQTGGRVFLFLNTENFQRDYQNLLNQGIKIVREPSVEIYGTVAVFEDLYGNLWDLIEPNNLK
jgi:catechol 2,3-dioxygenase-like lactoylglutathione lyase family enzyme